jgi:hypothetical protein
LHLTVKFHDGFWWATEVILLDGPRGFGTYVFQTASRLDVLDANVTFGAFIWDPYGDEETVPGSLHREIDFEDSRWGASADPTNAQAVVQPFGVPGNLHRYTIPNLGVDPALTRFFTWRPNRIDFVALSGHLSPFSYPSGSVIDQFSYIEDAATNHFVPTPGRESFRFNLWPNNVELGGAPPPRPVDGQPVEVVITDFRFMPLVRSIPFDFDADGKTDLATWRPREGNWYIVNSSTSTFTFTIRQWGLPGDKPGPGDYDGDGKTDMAIWRPSQGNWYVINSSTNTSTVYQWGLQGDIPVPGDYDGDGETDLAVWRPMEGNWYIIFSSTGTQAVAQWGLPDDIPVPGDYDGDGKTDRAVWRPMEGNWYIIFSSSSAFAVYQLGLSGDELVPGDYDGDGKTDRAVWRPMEGNWYIIFSSTGTQAVAQWGLPDDIPVPGDYDGDGKTDRAVWRPVEGNWYIVFSSTGTQAVAQWGLPDDIPVPSAFFR